MHTHNALHVNIGTFLFAISSISCHWIVYFDRLFLSSLDHPFLVSWSSISLVAPSSISCRSIVRFTRCLIVHFSSLDRPSSLGRPLIIERNKISHWQLSVPVTKRRQLCVLATKWQRLNVTYPSRTSRSFFLYYILMPKTHHLHSS